MVHKVAAVWLISRGELGEADWSLLMYLTLGGV